tara:strand:+ start:883 stop:1272 length:390 start_codon:yes stop_codon:yes gene_type:complete
MYKYSKFLLFFSLFFIPTDVNSEVNLTEILDGKSQEITQKIIELNNEIQIISEDDFVLSIENEKLLNNLLNIKKMLKKLKQDLIINDIEDGETIEMFNYALEASNSLICKKYQSGDFSSSHIIEFNIKC